MVTGAKSRRQKERGTDGRYTKYQHCEFCGKTVKGEYFSDLRCDDILRGRGLVLHSRCLGKIEVMDNGNAYAACKYHSDGDPR